MERQGPKKCSEYSADSIVKPMEKQHFAKKSDGALPEYHFVVSKTLTKHYENVISAKNMTCGWTGFIVKPMENQ